MPSAAFGRLRVETDEFNHAETANESAAFGRLRVETLRAAIAAAPESAAFGRLRVETVKK